MGRPTKCTRARIKRIVEGLEMGMTHALAAQYAGIGETTFYQWMYKGENGGTAIYREFREAVKAAEVANVAKCLQAIESHALKDWKAMAWLLERRHPQAFGRAVVEVTVRTEGGVQSMSDEDLEARWLELHEKRKQKQTT